MKFVKLIRANEEMSNLVLRATQPKMSEYLNKKRNLNEQKAKELFVELVIKTRDELKERVENGIYEKRLQEYNDIDKSFAKVIKQQPSPEDALNRFHRFMDKNDNLAEEERNIVRQEYALQKKYKSQLDSLYSETHDSMKSMALVANDDDWKQVLDAHKNWMDLQIQHFNQMLEER